MRVRLSVANSSWSRSCWRSTAAGCTPLLALDLLVWGGGGLLRWPRLEIPTTVPVLPARKKIETTGGTMPQPGDTRHQQHPYPVHVSSDDRTGARDEARRWVRRKRIFYTIVGIYLALSLMWFAIDMLDGPDSLWFYWPMLGTGLGVLITGVVTGGLGGLFGAGWERRQVEKYLEQRSNRSSGP
jgi:2TM domain